MGKWTIRSGGLLSLRISFAVSFLVAWNVGCFYARNLGAPSTREGLAVGGATCLLTAAIAAGIVYSESFRKLVTAPARRERYHPSIFVFLGIIAGFIGVVWLGGSLSAPPGPPASEPMSLGDAFQLLARVPQATPLLVILGGATWLIGGNILVAFHYRRVGKSMWSGFKPFAFPFKDFNANEWMVLFLLLVTSVALFVTGAALEGG